MVPLNSHEFWGRWVLFTLSSNIQIFVEDAPCLGGPWYLLRRTLMNCEVVFLPVGHLDHPLDEWNTASMEIVLKLSVAWNVDATGRSGHRWEIHPIIFFLGNLAFFSSTLSQISISQNLRISFSPNKLITPWESWPLLWKHQTLLMTPLGP